MIPGGDFHPLLFAIVAAWILLCGLGVVLFKRIMYSAVAMVFCFLGVAFASALLNAAFVAIVQLLVYVGAISVVVIFAIMLTEKQSGPLGSFFNRQTLIAGMVAAAGAAVLAVAVGAAGLGGEKALNPGVHRLSQLLFERFIFPFELVSLILVAALIGAIVLSLKKKEGQP